MIFWGYKVRLDGVPLVNWRRAGARCAPGELHLYEQRDELLGRTVRCASFRLLEEPGSPSWPVLLDAQLLTVRSDFLVIGGLEADTLTGRHVAQSWCLYCRPQEPGV